MKPTLFWKILLAFWMAIILANATNLLILASYTHFGRDVQNAFAAQRLERQRSAESYEKQSDRCLWPIPRHVSSPLALLEKQCLRHALDAPSRTLSRASKLGGAREGPVARRDLG